MNIKRVVYRASNRVLEKVGLSIQPLTRDFEARIVQPEALGPMFAALAGIFDEWISGQTLFRAAGSFDARQEIERFYQIYLNSSHRRPIGGSRFNNLLFLFLLAKSAEPAVIIDSGTFTGSSAWALSLGCPKAQVYSFDINLEFLINREAGVTYVEQDWMSFDWNGVDLSNSLVYFDDHVDQAQRLLEAVERGVPLAIFDDDFPVGAFAPMAHGGFALPKIEFLLDETLSKQTELKWVVGAKEYVWPIPHEKMARARKAICETARLPNTSLVTGIHQTPYRLVRVNIGV